MERSLLRLLVAIFVFGSCVASALDERPFTITAYCFSLKATDALPFLIDSAPLAKPGPALFRIRELVKAHRAEELGTIYAPFRKDETHARITQKNLELEAEWAPIRPGYVSVSATLRHQSAKVTNEMNICTIRGSAPDGELIIYGLVFLGYAYRDAGRNEVLAVFLSAR